MPEFSLIAALLAGLLGGTHCVGMCGGIVGALSLQLPGNAPQWRYHLAYNLGRILSYGIAGAIAGALGAGSLLLSDMLPAQKILYFLANLMLVLLGLYLAGIWRAVVYIERAGSAIWRRLQPWMKRLLPIKTTPGAFAVGMLWGWLPCGLVYSILITALASGSAGRGGLVMLAFGLGTLPNLLAMGFFARQLKPLLQQRWVKRIAGITVAGLGGWGLFRLFFG